MKNLFENAQDFASGLAPLKLNRSGEPSSHDSAIAVLVTLCDIACVDEMLDSEEFQAIVASACAALGNSESETGELLEVASFLMRDSTKRDRFREILNAEFSATQRQTVLTMVWRVILSDRALEKSEAEFSVKLRKQLGLSLEQAAYARQVAEEELKSSTKTARPNGSNVEDTEG